MGRFRDLTGERFGRLLVHKADGYNKHHQLYWLCECDCGKHKHVLGYSLRNGVTQSCGCLHKETTAAINLKHGMTRTPIYGQWHSMMQRCYDKNSQAYDRYGARGITVCDRWHDFENFYADMGDKPEGMSLERGDNDDQYSPENVKWATTKEQANNRRSSKFIEHDGKRMTIAQWADHVGIEMRTLWSRLKRGIPMAEALESRDRRYNYV
jgi:hypothetical protein